MNDIPITAKDAKFNLEFCLTMMMAGRTEEAERAFREVLEYLNERIEQEELT